MDPNALLAEILDDLTTFRLRGLLREAQEVANRLPAHSAQTGTYGLVHAARERITGESEVSAHWAATAEWRATDLDGAAAQRLLDLQEWLDRGGFRPAAGRIDDLDRAYCAAHAHLPVNIRARVCTVLKDMGGRDYLS